MGLFHVNPCANPFRRSWWMWRGSCLSWPSWRRRWKITSLLMTPAVGMSPSPSQQSPERSGRSTLGVSSWINSSLALWSRPFMLWWVQGVLCGCDMVSGHPPCGHHGQLCLFSCCWGEDLGGIDWVDWNCCQEWWLKVAVWNSDLLHLKFSKLAVWNDQ